MNMQAQHHYRKMAKNNLERSKHWAGRAKMHKANGQMDLAMLCVKWWHETLRDYMEYNKRAQAQQR